jgi:hypothetical protein
MTHERRQPSAPASAPAAERRRPRLRRRRGPRRQAVRYAGLAVGIVFLASVLDGLYAGDALDQVANPARVAAARSCHVEAVDVVHRDLGTDWRVSPFHKALVKDLGAGRYRVEMRAEATQTESRQRVLCSAVQLDPGAGAIVAVDVRLRPEI